MFHIFMATVTVFLWLGHGSRPEPGIHNTLPRKAFERVKALTGTWMGKSTKGWEERIYYDSIAGGSVVVGHSFDAHPNEEMYTMYHMDGDRLMLTHYCMAKNQPRLVATDIAEDCSRITFTFLDGTNMTSRNTGHMDSCVLTFKDDSTFTCRWTWYRDGKEKWMEEVICTRVDG